MSSPMKVIKNEPVTDFEKQLESIGRTDFVKKQLTPPHFPDHEDLKAERPFGALKSWLKKLAKPATDQHHVKPVKK
jgi:hypothetical protein